MGSIDHAQADLDRHVVSRADGLCVACGVPGPCEVNERAARLFRSSLKLPQRRADVSRPELFGARRVGATGLLLAS
ncbi:hypothetical protein ABT369_24080 [Dactylosporangium sp. NPDC000244]|uniref:hypothetical protein n=1 Tax=Dactylosporangium sp. NPDC000244 TaxID=3154365 RepID=UPI003319A6A0